jgi:hypothetical protein
LIFYPDLSRVKLVMKEWASSPYDRLEETEESLDSTDLTKVELFHIIERNRRIIASESVGHQVALNMVKPLLVAEIPILEVASLEDYCHLAAEEFPTQFDALRDHLRLRLMNLDDLQEDGAVIEAALTLQIEINSAIRQLESDLKLSMRKAAVEVTGAGIATVTAALYAITGNSVIVETGGVLGASGGLWGIMSRANTYLAEREVARNSPYYFLWALSRPRKRS